MSHTKGPWDAGIFLSNQGGRINITHSLNEKGAISQVLAQVIARQTWRAEAEANARLIAAAPSLLHALEEVETHLDSIRQGFVSLAIRADNEADASYYDHEINACASYSELIRAAIAKAKGE